MLERFPDIPFRSFSLPLDAIRQRPTYCPAELAPVEHFFMRKGEMQCPKRLYPM